MVYPRQSDFRSAEPRSAWFEVLLYVRAVTHRFVIQTEGLHAVVECQRALAVGLEECESMFPGQMAGSTLSTTRTPGHGAVRLLHNRQAVVSMPKLPLVINGRIDATFVAAAMFQWCERGLIGVDNAHLADSLFTHDTRAPLFTGLYYWLASDRALHASMLRLSGLAPPTDLLSHIYRPRIAESTILPEWGRAAPVPTPMAPQVAYLGTVVETPAAGYVCAF